MYVLLVLEYREQKGAKEYSELHEKSREKEDNITRYMPFVVYNIWARNYECPESQ